MKELRGCTRENTNITPNRTGPILHSRNHSHNTATAKLTKIIGAAKPHQTTHSTPPRMEEAKRMHKRAKRTRASPIRDDRQLTMGFIVLTLPERVCCKRMLYVLNRAPAIGACNGIDDDDDDHRRQIKSHQICIYTSTQFMRRSLRQQQQTHAGACSRRRRRRHHRCRLLSGRGRYVRIEKQYSTD